jgi:hypothetical protein
VRSFLGIANYLSAVHFRADAVYSFIREADVKRGSADANGFDRRAWSALRWENPPLPRTNSEVLVYRLKETDDDYFQTIIQEQALHAAE